MTSSMYANTVKEIATERHLLVTKHMPKVQLREEVPEQ